MVSRAGSVDVDGLVGQGDIAAAIGIGITHLGID